MRFLPPFSASLTSTLLTTVLGALLCAAGPAGAEVDPGLAHAGCPSSDLATIALARINALRAAGADCHSAGRIAPSAQLSWSTLLTLAAQRHAQDMVDQNFFSHAGSNGSTPGQRVRDAGFAWRAVGENVAVGFFDIDTVLAGFMASDGHCSNLMDAGYTEVGMVCQPGNAGNAYANYWTMDLARPR